MLPCESDNRRDISSLFSVEFELANRLLCASTEFPDKIALSRTHSAPVRALMSAMVAREIRRYRSIIAILELGYLENVEILTRSLYESVLSEHFILRTPNNLVELSDRQRELANLTPDFRTELYFCHRVIRLKKQYEKIIRAPDVGDPLGPDRGKSILRMADEAEQLVGPKWSKRLKDSNTCAGLSIEELARYCGMTGIHLQLYFEMCNKSHASDAFDYAKFSGDTLCLQIGPNVANFRTVFLTATALFVQLLGDLNELLALDMTEKLGTLSHELARMQLE